VVNQDGGYFYSGLSGFLRYSIIGDLTTVHQVTTYNGSRIAEHSVSKGDRLAVGVGLEQLLINGTQSVYLAVGPSVSISYSFQVLRNRFEIMGRYSPMIANENPLSAVAIDLSFLLDL
jgi:hypothetical protein